MPWKHSEVCKRGTSATKVGWQTHWARWRATLVIRKESCLKLLPRIDSLNFWPTLHPVTNGDSWERENWSPQKWRKVEVPLLAFAQRIHFWLNLADNHDLLPPECPSQATTRKHPFAGQQPLHASLSYNSHRVARVGCHDSSGYPRGKGLKLKPGRRVLKGLFNNNNNVVCQWVTNLGLEGVEGKHFIWCLWTYFPCRTKLPRECYSMLVERFKKGPASRTVYSESRFLTTQGCCSDSWLELQLSLSASFLNFPMLLHSSFWKLRGYSEKLDSTLLLAEMLTWPGTSLQIRRDDSCRAWACRSARSHGSHSCSNRRHLGWLPVASPARCHQIFG